MAIDDLATSGFMDKIITRFDPFQGVERLLHFASRGNRCNPDGATRMLVPEKTVSNVACLCLFNIERNQRCREWLAFYDSTSQTNMKWHRG